MSSESDKLSRDDYDVVRKLELQVQRIVSHIDSEHGSFSFLSKDLKTKYDEHNILIRGNGKEGILTRLDRLEQIEERRKWLFRATLGALVATSVSSIISLIFVMTKLK